MTWRTTQSWIKAMNTANFLGHNQWRLPTTPPTKGAHYNYNYKLDGSSDVVFNVSAPGTPNASSTGSEVAFLLYNSLGNTGE